jgi:hypothetical protein
MRIGLSLSRCVRDIFEGRTDREKVLVIIARTDFDPEIDKQWKSVWRGYSGHGFNSAPEWAMYQDHEEDFRDICIYLKKSGKLHQPRQFDAYPMRLPYYWLDTFAPEEEIAKSPAVVKAWDQYKLLAGLE